MDGIETARKLVEKFNCAIIFLTGQSSKEIYERSFKIKPFGYLLKPIDMEQTKMTIEIAAYQRNLEIENVIYQQQLEDLLEERKRENDEIKTLYESIVNNSLIGMIIMQDDRIILANQQIAEIFGYSQGEFSSLSVNNLLELVHPDDRQDMSSRIYTLLQGSETSKTSYIRISRKDGTVTSLKTSSRVVQYYGKPAIHQIFVDISPR
jgi:PAS domain S-box-containing protein